ncbi:DUF2793 domain-containing protein [Sphingomonas sp. Tas61C01]|uniref:DUF2793 domain-containing protein n=1 Tax=Sphingomonas sp. Tas61C01 TaxID=3458297 RepID=UPI00403E53A3
MSGTDATIRLGLPLLAAGQAQKDLTHNEALARLDIAVQASVVAVGLAVPPAAPTAGDAWVVGAAAGGAWTGQANAIAAWTAGGWRFVDPREGMTVWSIADRRDVRYSGGTWTSGDLRGGCVLIDGVKVVGARGGAITAPAGGTVIDKEARAALAAVLAALRGHGLIAE